jgi:hypothetical protein
MFKLNQNPLNLIVGGLLQILSGSMIVEGGLTVVGITMMAIGGFTIVFGPIFLLMNKIWEE